ncbi:ectonucleoside triphosphate diphosphohydrolase 2 [Python bivittatus]|uniref:Ectonucleoside triphosphate diphosphohydrolase 2 n=1 Tax=Python bivittatus TaxID=176946 RepID=A0A9F5IJY6_PYTBI|nr:ectonucleoside triphosphate diphosphohydrolase 2 [Python bivittatus]
MGAALLGCSLEEVGSPVCSGCLPRHILKAELFACKVPRPCNQRRGEITPATRLKSSQVEKLGIAPSGDYRKPVAQPRRGLAAKPTSGQLFAASEFGIVLDAGSSHTAMFVYKWPSDKENETGIVSQHSDCHVKGGGISSYATDPPAAGQSLRACLDQALEDVPKARHAITPLYLGATAGMRLLNIFDPQASDSVLEAVTATLKQYPFDFRGARILSGEDEGLFGWVTANYLLENFIKYGWIGRWIRPKKKTVGAMDLGGASTQITFETTGTIESPTNEVTLKLYGQPYKVYTHSFLCYGMNEVLNRLVSKVLKANGYTLRVSNPCWPQGFKRSFPMESVYGSPCASPEKPTNYFPKAMVNMSGSGDAAQCLLHAESLFQFTDCPYSRCSFDRVFQPPIEGNFIAFSAFFYTVDFIRSVMNRPVATPDDLREAAGDICSTTWTELLKKAPKLETHLQNYCSMATFVSLLLTRGYSFSNSTFPTIAFQQKAGDTTIGWALGYMLNLTNMIPAEEPSFRKSSSFGPWVGLILLFVAILLGSLMSIFCLLRSSKGRGAM